MFEKLDSEYTISDKIDLHFIITRTDDKIPSLVYLLKDVIKPTETTIIFTSTKFFFFIFNFLILFLIKIKH